MDRSVAEGMSASLQTCSPIPQPYDFQGLFPSSPSHLPVNDLGLTPPPGSQLMQLADSQEANVTKSPVKQRQSEHASRNESALSFQGAGHSDFADPILDSELALQVFEESFDPRKRTGDETFPGDLDSLAPPEKRRFLEPPRTQDLSPPHETPSLSSSDSSHRTDQVETVPNTSAGVERQQTPDSLFDSLDNFEDPTFAVSAAETVPSHGPGEGSLSNLGGAEQSTRPIHEVASYEDINIPSAIDTAHPVADTTPSVSSVTKRRFSLNDQDVVGNAAREMLQRIDPQPGYISPYPLHGGPLGYLPSSPVIHVKFIQAAEDRVCDGMANLTRQVKRLGYERDKYRTTCSLYTTVDEATGKTKGQLLHEENGRLRRAASKHREQAEMYRREADEWRNRFSDLAITYNNLLLEFQSQRRVTIAPPAGYSARPGSARNTAMQQAGQTRVPSYPTPNQQPGTLYPGPPGANQLAVASSTESHTAGATADPMPIDLTDDRPRPAQSRNGPQLLRSFRNKRYSWLGNGGCPNQPASNLDGRDRQDDDDDLAREMEEELART